MYEKINFKKTDMIYIYNLNSYFYKYLLLSGKNMKQFHKLNKINHSERKKIWLRLEKQVLMSVPYGTEYKKTLKVMNNWKKNKKKRSMQKDRQSNNGINNCYQGQLTLTPLALSSAWRRSKSEVKAFVCWYLLVNWNDKRKKNQWFKYHNWQNYLEKIKCLAMGNPTENK